MSSREMQIAIDVTAALEERLGREFTSQHDVFFDPDVAGDGTPFVAVGVSGPKGVETLRSIFGDAVVYGDRHSKQRVNVPILVYSIESKAGLN